MNKNELEGQLHGVLGEIKSELANNKQLGSRMERLDQEYVEIKAAIGALDAKLGEMQKPAPVAAPVKFERPGDVIAREAAGRKDFQEFAQKKNGLRQVAYESPFMNPFEVKAAVGDANYGYQADASRPNDARTILSVENEAAITKRDQRPLLLWDLFGKKPTDKAFIQWVQEDTRTKNATGVAEGALKTNSALTTLNRVSEAVTIATHITASRQLLADVDEMEEFIRDILMNAVAEHVEDQLLNGDGDTDAGNLQGLMTNSDIDSQAFVTNIYDTVRAGVRELRKNNWSAEPDGLIVNHDDHYNMDVLKGSDGHYLWIDRNLPAARTNTDGLWRIPVVPTNAIESGYGLLGNFKRGAIIRELEAMKLLMSYDNEDNFVKNMATALVEMRLHFITKWPGSFVKLGLISGY